LKIYDSIGNTILTKNIDSTNGKIDISKLSSGIYIVKANGIYSRIIVK